jgi:C-terminal processing protease CtpA/Prc
MRRTTPLRGLVLSAALVALTAPSMASAGAWLGVYTQEVSAELREAFGLSGEGALVSRVVPDGPAARAGLLEGDVIVAANLKDVGSPSELTDLIGAARAGESVSLGIVRKGERKTIAVRLAERPEAGEMPAPRAAPSPKSATPAPTPKPQAAPHARMRWYSSEDVDPDEIREQVRRSMPNFEFDSESLGPNEEALVLRGFGRGRLGVRIETLSDDLASALGVPGTKGALVVEVYKKTPAEAAGIRAGDVITAVGTTAVYDTDDLVQALRDGKGKVSVSLVRRGEKRTVEAALEDSPRVIRLRDGRGPMGLGRLGDDGKFDVHIHGDADDEDLRKELDQLRRELSELRKELEDHR